MKETHGRAGGVARTMVLSPERRREIVKKATKARWNTSFPRATHSGSLLIGTVELPCHIIQDENGKPIRLMTLCDVNEAFTGKKVAAGISARKCLVF